MARDWLVIVCGVVLLVVLAELIGFWGALLVGLCAYLAGKILED